MGGLGLPGGCVVQRRATAAVAPDGGGRGDKGGPSPPAAPEGGAGERGKEAPPSTASGPPGASLMGC
eukprot:1804306-Alexandrium_andersonii.AAC.1